MCELGYVGCWEAVCSSCLISDCASARLLYMKVGLTTKAISHRVRATIPRLDVNAETMSS